MNRESNKNRIEKQLQDLEPCGLSDDEKKQMWSKIHSKLEPFTLRTSNKNTLTGRRRSQFIFLFTKSFIPALIVLLVIAGSGTTIALANGARPGDLLFPIDTASEKIQLALSSGNTKDFLRVEHSKERLDEVKSIISQYGTNTIKYNENIQSTKVARSTNTEGSFINTTDQATTSVDNTEDQTTNKTSKTVVAHNIKLTESALLVALEHVKINKDALIAKGNDSAASVLDNIIEELTKLAGDQVNQLESVTVKITSGKGTNKTQIVAVTDELKTKFKLETNNNKTKILFENGEIKDGNSKNKKKNTNEEDDEDEDVDEDENHKDSKKNNKKGDGGGNKITICHKGKNIHVSRNALFGHKIHGDPVHECEDVEDEDSDSDDDDAGDITPPIFERITGTTTIDSANITWETDEKTTAVLWYSSTTPLTIGAGTTQIKDETLDDDHSVNILNLPENTMFYYKISAEDASGNVATSSEKSFRTLIAPDNTPPVITNIETVTGTTTISISWTTSEPSTSLVWASTTTPLDITGTPRISNDSLVNIHSFTLTNLLPDTIYYLVVASVDAAENAATSTEMMFETKQEADTTAPIISSLMATDIASTTADVSVVTNEETTAKLWYATSTPVDTSTPPNEIHVTLASSYSFSLTGLTASTTYQFIVEVQDASQNTSTSTEQSFETLN